MVRDALVVGINSYQAQDLRDLQSPAKDAEAIARILEEHGEFNVTRLPEALTKDTKQPYVGEKIKVSLAQLEDALVQLFNPQGRNIPDTALFYFSGHGIRSTSGITEGFLASSDVSPNQRFYGLSLQWLRRLLQESPIKQQIIWLDCCHSGELFNFEEANPGDIGKARDRCFIAASREFEQAYQDLGSEYSILTKVLLEGLDPNRCPQQWVNNISLTNFIFNNLKNEIQRPVYSNFGAAINLTRILTATDNITQTEATAEICPYKGLQYFESDDADYFYGREELTDTLLNKIRQDNFIAILGASGSGKSSVLRAGLIYQLQQGHKLANSRNWQILITVPTEYPLKRLAELFVDPNLPQLDKAEQLGKAEGLLKEGAEGLRRLVQTAEASRIVLIIDQFEEVFTLCQDDEEREKFLQCILGALATTENKLCLILAMRVDFFGKCLAKDYSGLGKKIEENLVTVTAMNEKQLKEAIIKPAERVNLIVEDELVGEMFRDVKNSPGILPLLQYTLTEIWKRKTDNCLKLTTYIKLGRIAGTLNKRATEVYKEFSLEEKETVKHIFISLTQLGEGTEDTRRRVLKRNLITEKHPETVIDNVVKKLADEKLIVTSEQIAKGSQISSEPVVDVAHEALIRNWDLLGQWLDENRSQLLEQRKIEKDAQEWQNSKNKSDYLLQGWRLKEAKKFQKESSEKYPLSTNAEIFIKKSIRKQRNNLFKFLIIPLVGTGIIGFLVYGQISIQIAWGIVQETQGERYDLRRHRALETLVFWREPLKNELLEKANLSRIELPYAYLGGANLNSAYLKAAKLGGANLESANLESANLENAYLESANLENAYLDDANFRGANLENANLESANLENAYLDGANFRGANLKAANLESANLENANLDGANFRGANLKAAKLRGANLESAKLRGANLESANLISANLYSADLDGANLEVANLGGANLESAYLDRAKLRGANLDRANLESAYLKNAKLEVANLGGANLNSSYLYRANLDSANLDSANLDSANLDSANLNSAYLNSADLGGANLKNADLGGANLESANLKNANLNSSYLYRANLESADLGGADLESANLRGADLGGADLESANLRGADLGGADLGGADLGGANLDRAKNLTNSQIKFACFWDKAYYKAHWDEKQYKYIIDEPANKQYIEQLKQDKSSDPEISPDCSMWE